MVCCTLTNKSFIDTVLEGYIFYKNDNPIDQRSRIRATVAASRKAEIIPTCSNTQMLDKNWDIASRALCSMATRLMRRPDADFQA